MVLQTVVGGDQEDEYKKIQEDKLEVTTLQEYFAKFAAKKPNKKKNKIEVKKNPLKQMRVSNNYVMRSVLDKFDYWLQLYYFLL